MKKDGTFVRIIGGKYEKGDQLTTVTGMLATLCVL